MGTDTARGPCWAKSGDRHRNFSEEEVGTDTENRRAKSGDRHRWERRGIGKNEEGWQGCRAGPNVGTDTDNGEKLGRKSGDRHRKQTGLRMTKEGQKVGKKWGQTPLGAPRDRQIEGRFAEAAGRGGMALWVE